MAQQRETNPPIRLGWITDAVAHTITIQMSCAEYLQMSDTELTNLLKALGVNAVSMRHACQNGRNTEYGLTDTVNCNFISISDRVD